MHHYERFGRPSKIVWLLLLLLPLSSFTQGLPLRRFQHTAWNVQNGAPSQVTALAQTTDGYIWLGTPNGLFRFDGVTFEAYQPPHNQQFHFRSIQSLSATSDGGLWIGYTLGFTCFLKDGVLHNYSLKGLRGAGTIFGFAFAQDGTLWAAGQNGPLHFISGRWQDPAENAKRNVTASYLLYPDRKGTLWVATDDYVYVLRKGATSFEKTDILGGTSATFTEGQDGAMWIGNGYGLIRYDETVKGQGRIQYLFKSKATTSDIRFDNSGALWVFSGENGIIRAPQPVETLRLPATAREAAIEHYTSRNGLTSDSLLSSLKDREGNIWVGSVRGLDRFRLTDFEIAPLSSTFYTYAVAPGAGNSIFVGTGGSGLQLLSGGSVSRVPNAKLKVDTITSVFRARDGKLWLGGRGDLGYFQNGSFVDVPLPPVYQSPPRDTQTITEDGHGDIWIGTAGSVPVQRLHQGAWLPVADSYSTAGPPFIMTTDHTGRVWAGYMAGVLKIFDGSKVSVITAKEGLTVSNVTAIYDSGQEVWIGGQSGLDVIKNGRPVDMTFAGDAKIDGISGIMRTEDGSLWLNALAGIVHVSKQEVEQSLADSTHPMHIRLFNYLDGIPGKAPQLRPLPSIVHGAGQTLWFSTIDGVLSIDTAKTVKNSVVPPVYIQSVIEDGNAVDGKDLVSLRKGTQDLEINYTALSLSIPERVLFRYKLENFDKDWQDAGTRRQALYPRLPPGRYTFHVIACNNDGLWNDTGASIVIDLPPTFLQSWLFKGLLAILALTALWLFYLLRLRQETAKVQDRIYQRFSERERIARDLHDTFFQGIQGLLLGVQSVSRGLPEESESKAALEEMLIQSDSVMSQGRELVFNLRTRSKDANDLGSQLETSAKEFGLHYASTFTLTVLGDPKNLHAHVCEELGKLGREALCNAYRHAKAAQIEARIEYRPDALRLLISDDGVGIDKDILAKGAVENHWGLPGMKERASSIGADFRVVSGYGSGTIIQVEVAAQLAYAQFSRGTLRRLQNFFRLDKPKS